MLNLLTMLNVLSRMKENDYERGLNMKKDELDEIEWIAAFFEVTVENGDLESADKIWDKHPELGDYYDEWCRKNGIELPE